MKKRCDWVGEDPIYIKYHDTEWGVPLHDDNKLFEAIVLDGAQAGLNWLTILKRRDNYRKAFDNFDPYKVSKYDSEKIENLLKDKGIIRNRLKVLSAVTNANAFLKIKDEFGNFNDYLWGFTNGTTIKNRWKTEDEIPTETKESRNMSKDLKKRGFKFVGPTICYALMQAIGMVNDHTIDCFRYNEV